MKVIHFYFFIDWKFWYFYNLILQTDNQIKYIYKRCFSYLRRNWFETCSWSFYDRLTCLQRSLIDHSTRICVLVGTCLHRTENCACFNSLFSLETELSFRHKILYLTRKNFQLMMLESEYLLPTSWPFHIKEIL